MSDSDASPKRQGKSYKFDPRKPQAVKKLLSHIAMKAKRSIKDSNNMGKIIASIAKGKYVSTSKHAISGTFVIDLTDVMAEIQSSINDYLIGEFTPEGLMLNAAGQVVNDPDAAVVTHTTAIQVGSSELLWLNSLDEGGKPKLKFKTTLFAESSRAEPIDTLSQTFKSDAPNTKELKMKFKVGVPALQATAGYTIKEAKVITKTKSLACASREVLDNADEKLEGLIHDTLSSDLRSKLEQRFDRAEAEDEDTSHPGQFSISWLQEKFGVAQMEIISLVEKYMEYLSTVKTSDQNLYQFASALKGKLDALHDSKWSMNDLFLILIMAHTIKSSDVDERGEKVDYSSITAMITKALNGTEPLMPYRIVEALEKQAKMAKSALKLVHDGTAAEALSTTVSKGNNKPFDKTPPPGLGFGSIGEALWCSYCAKTKVHLRKGWNGWNQPSVNSVKAHVHRTRQGKILCPIAVNAKKPKNSKPWNSGGKENKSSHSASLEAQVATLTSLVAELAKANN